MRLPFSPQERSEFLTGKVRPRLTLVDFLLWPLWLLFEGLMITATVSLVLDGSFDAALIGFVLFAPLIWPFAARMRNLIFSRSAIAVAQALEGISQQHLSGSEFEKVVPACRRGRLEKLINQGYLTNLSYDPVKDHVFLLRRLQLSARQLAYTCAACGARGVIDLTRKPACPYCGAGLTLPRKTTEETR